MALKFLQNTCRWPILDSPFVRRRTCVFSNAECVRKHWRAIRTREHRNTKKSHTRSLAKRLRLNSRLARPESRVVGFTSSPSFLLAWRQVGIESAAGEENCILTMDILGSQGCGGGGLKGGKHLWRAIFEESPLLIRDSRCRCRRAQVKRSLIKRSKSELIILRTMRPKSTNN